MKKIRRTGRGVPPSCNKCFQIMKLTFFFFLIGLMQVSASLYSQTTKLKLEMHNKKVVEVLEEIEKQSEFRFAYSSEYIDMNRRVSVELNEKSIEETLQVLFAGTGVKYVIRNRHIMLYPKDMDLYSESIFSQQKNITGKVTDTNGQSLPGVTILIKGTTQGVVTDANGNYSLPGVPIDATLVFSFVGMRTQEVPVAGRSSINVTMQEE
ncbi:Outer membrane TonB-dependent transporter, utilization system for glycans and polysaccharides (PUL), SusC family, partial [hydrothermal vent metagenome]